MGRRLSGKIKAVLKRRALEELGSELREDVGLEAGALEYVVLRIASGATFANLADEVAAELGEPVSRQFMSHVSHRLGPDAREVLRLARTQSADALAEQALAIAERPAATMLDLQRDRHLMAMYMWLAERMAPDVYGRRGPKANPASAPSAMHLAALRSWSAASTPDVAEVTR